MRRSLVASAILATLLSAPLGLAALPLSAAEVTDSDRATAALRYLWAAQLPDGSIDGSIGETADFVIGTADAGFDPSTLRTCSGTAGALDFLAAASDSAAVDAAKTGKAVLAVVAAGDDPTAFAGRDVLARLAALYHSDSGAYGDGSTFAQSFAILGLRSAGVAIPATAIAELKTLQGSDGSWSYTATAPAAGEGDTNSTAIALMALDAAGDHSADSSALAYLHTQQLSDGGFPYQNSSAWGPPTSDPDSDSIVIEALIAAGQDPEGSAWLQGSNSAFTNLRAAQGSDGGFVYPGFGESAFTTSQVPAALSRVPYGAAVSWTAGRSLPAIACPTPTATPSPTASATATASPSPTRTAPPGPTALPTALPTAHPTVAPTPTSETSATEPALTAQPSPAASPAQTAEPSPIGLASPSPTSGVEGAVSEPADSGDSPLPYVAAAAVALLVVAGGGWVLSARPGRR
jgi:hypothetical protein